MNENGVRDVLKTGDVVQSDIVTHGAKGVLLVAKGTEVTDKLLDSLSKFDCDFRKLRVVVKRDNQIIDSNATPKNEASAQSESGSTELKMSDRLKQDAVKAARNLFSNELTIEQMQGTAKEISSDIANSILAVSDKATVCIQDLRVADEYTYQHSVDVSILAAMLGKKLGLPESEIRQLTEAGLLHDLGKRRIPSDIINKPGKLTDDEFAFMKQHPLFGYMDLEQMSGIDAYVKKGVIEHHEKVNGKGYPFGMTGDKISRGAKILAIADVYDALTSKRSYKDGMSSARAIGIMTEMIDSFDKAMFAVFLTCVTLYPLGSRVLCTDGQVYTVIKHCENSPVKPLLMNEASKTLVDLNESGCKLKIFGEDCAEMHEKLREMKNKLK